MDLIMGLTTFHGLIEIPQGSDFDYLGEPGNYCQVTAYLPDENIFAVYGNTWITFHWTEEQFLTCFNYIPPEKCYNIEGITNYDY